MLPSTHVASYVSVLLLLVGLLGGSMTANAQTHSPRPEPNRIQVQAQAEVSIVPDMATLDARLWERTSAMIQSEEAQSDPEALAAARERLERRTGELIRTLEQAGLESQAIRAGSLTVRPDYIQRPTTPDNPADVLVRTQLERSVSLTINDLERLPVILDALTQAGVNTLDGIVYDLKDRDAATDQALTRALEKSRRKAQLIADTLGVELGPVLSVQETSAPVFAPRMHAMRSDAMESQASPEYRPGEITIEAGVGVDWGIEP